MLKLGDKVKTTTGHQGVVCSLLPTVIVVYMPDQEKVLRFNLDGTRTLSSQCPSWGHLIVTQQSPGPKLPSNPHADLIDQYAQDWKETDTPWERWEFQGFGENTWAGLTMAHPTWNPETKYRRKPIPEFILVNGAQVPAPYKGQIRAGVTYYYAVPSSRMSVGEIDRINLDFAEWLRDNNMLHQTAANAISHAEAMRVVKPI